MSWLYWLGGAASIGLLAYLTIGRTGSSAFRLDRPRLGGSRPIVETLRPTSSAMLRIGMRSRRNCSTEAFSDSSMTLRVLRGRELRSAKP